MVDYHLAGKVALITGGADGIGKDLAKNFLASGCRVALVDIKQEEGMRAEAELETLGEVKFFYCDLSVSEDLEQMFRAVLAHFDKVDILINNAGVPVRGYIEDITPEWWDSFNSVNMKAAFFLSKLAAGNMCKRNWGRIVNISSVRAKVIDHYHPGYNITKAGLNAITQNFGVRYAQRGITSNAIMLGFVLTPMTEHYLEEAVAVEVLNKINPQERMIEMQEVSDLALFLASDQAKGLNAQIIALDGGGIVASPGRKG